MKYFKVFIEENGGTSAFQNLKTEDVSEKYVKPATFAHKTSLLKILLDNKSSYTENAEWFISHAWKYNFLDTINIMEDFFKKENGNEWEDTVVWFDLFCNSQHSTSVKEFEWWASEFSMHLGTIGKILVLTAKVDDVSSPASSELLFRPYCFKRVWCIFEFYSAIKSGCRFEVAMSASDESNLSLVAASDARSLFIDVRNQINFKTAEATKDSDKDDIQRVIETSIGYYDIELAVYSALVKVFLRKLGMYDTHTVPSMEQQQALDIITKLCFEECTKVSTNNHLAQV